MRKTVLLLITISLLSATICNAQKWINYKAETRPLSDTLVAMTIDSLGQKCFLSNDGLSVYNDSVWVNYPKVKSMGLTSSVSLTSICVDKQNNKWIGTRGLGLVKFNGQKWISYPRTDTTDFGSINAVQVDKDGNIWVGCLVGGLFKYDGTRWTHYDTPKLIRCITFDTKTGDMWVGTNGLGVYRYDGSTWTNYSIKDGLKDSVITTIVIDASGNKWAGTIYGGLQKYDGSKWTTYSKTDGLLSDEIWGIAIDKDTNKWCAVVNGVSKLEGNTWISYPSSQISNSSSIYDVMIDKKNTLWISSFNGLIRYDGTKWESYSATHYKGLASNRISAIAVDKDNKEWIATRGGGVSVLNNTLWVNHHKSDSTEITDSDDVLAIYIGTNGYKYIGTNGRGYSVYNDAFWMGIGAWTTTAGHVVTKTYSFVEDKKGKVWVGNDGTLNKIDTVDYNVARVGIKMTYNNTIASGNTLDSIYTLALDNDSVLWLGKENGITKYKNSLYTNYTIADGLLDSRINAVAVDKNNVKWIGTNKGISLYNGHRFTSITTANSGLASDSVSCIAVDIVGNIWIGTKDKGLSRYDGTGWKTYTTTDGLSSNAISCIAFDTKGNKWIGTYNDGICKYDDGVQKGIVFIDENKNGIKDSTEQVLANQLVKVNSSDYVATQSDGTFYYSIVNGKYIFTYTPKGYWHLTTDSVITVNVTDSTALKTIYFGVAKNENISDVLVSINATASRAGFNAVYWVNYQNIGSVKESGSLSLQLDARTSILSADPIANLVNGNSLTWNFSELAPQETRQIAIYTKMPGIVYLSDTLLNNANISIQNQDKDLTNNSVLLKQRVIGSFDPNDKQVAQGEGTQNYVLHNTLLDYTIRFQNTGNDTAFLVSIADTINNNMDISTLQIVSSSHTVSLELKDNNVVIFKFENILLPDSTKNKSGSQGFVKYSIKPKTGLTDDTEVGNKADIYFDYNTAVVTNTVSNTFVTVIPKGAIDAVNTVSDNESVIYPNPATNGFYVKTANPTSVTLFALSGEKLWTKNISVDKYLDISSLPKGMYIVKLVTENGITEQKVMKQ